MLYEIECDKFVTKENGRDVPRGRIRFREGLNTVLGDKKADNAIGKSTFLLALDFCFGGDDYLNPEVNNVVAYVKDHTIKFAFRFGGHIEYYKRDTANPKEVIPCDQSYEAIGDPIDIEEFRKHLRSAYRIETAQNTWRNLVGRYSRIYGKDNYDERRPLKNGQESVENAIHALEQLFGIYNLVKDLEDSYKKLNDDKLLRKKVANIEGIGWMVTNKGQVRENEDEIKQLEDELEELTSQEDRQIALSDTDNLDKAAGLKGQITVLKRKRSRLLSQLQAVKANLEDGLTPTADDLAELQEYFPGVNMERLETIENFHRKIQRILSSEIKEEIDAKELLIKATTAEVNRLEEEQRKLGVPTNISKKYLDQVVYLRSRIASLQKQNKGYRDMRALTDKVSVAKDKMEKVREEQLGELEALLNREMERLNDFIYDGTQDPPEIHFENAKSGKPKYQFRCESNMSAGDNYKSLIIYDLSIMANTELPFLMHDSNIFKNVADLPIDRIMQLYMKSSKQIFITFDKADAYTDYTRETLYGTKILELYTGGGELFGWSWKKKNKQTPQ